MRVIFVTGAHEVAMEIGLQEPVFDIKWKIEQVLGVPIASQTLSIFGWELIDGLDMSDYPVVTEGTKIDLSIKSSESSFLHCDKIQISVTISAKQIIVDVERTETVQSLKEKIHVMNGTPIKRMMLFSSGTEMVEDSRSLSEYGIRQSSEIVVFLKTMARPNDNPSARMISLVIQTSSALLNGASIPLNVQELRTVAELRQLLLSCNILPTDDYLFIHKQRIMRENNSLRWHGVENEDRIYVFKGTVTQGEY